jgi:endoglucanase
MQTYLGEDRRSAERRRRAAQAVFERRSGRDRRAARAVTAAALAGMLAASPAMAGKRPPAPTPSPTPAPSASASGNPFAGARFYVDPGSNARRTADSWRSTRPSDAAAMDKLASGSQADWFGNWNADILAAVDSRVSAISATGAVSVLVAYNIPNRDCSGLSGGGAPTAAAYRDWIRRFALGIGSRRAAVVLEPDALAQLCGTAAEQQTRLDLLWDAVQVLKANPATAVYIDAGHSNWLAADVAASRLQAAGVAQANGFSLNVSNFNPTANELAYGNTVAQRIGGKHFVIDTSRNGLGPSTTWCNPPGEALGQRPTAQTGNATADAYLWVKRPGESDGTCNGGPNAGSWWADYALGLAQRAAF